MLFRSDDTVRRLEATEAERSRLQSLVEQSAARDRKFAELEHCAREAAEEAACLRQQADELRGKIAELERERAERERICPEPAAESVVETIPEPVAAESIANEPIADASVITVDAPVSAADVLARLGRAGIWRDDNSATEQPGGKQLATETPPSPAPIPTEHLFATPATPDAPAASPPLTPPSLSSRDVIPRRERVTNDDESIEDYMARLLKRVRGDQAARSYKESGAKADSDAADRLDTTAEPAAVEDEVVTPPAAVTPEPVAEPMQYTPRAVPPEFKANLAAMREIANSSARSAIETHHKSSGRQTSKFKLFSALGITAASSIALTVADDKLWQYACIGIGYLTAAFWLAQSLRGYFIPQRLRERSLSPPASVATVSPSRDESAE